MQPCRRQLDPLFDALRSGLRWWLEQHLCDARKWHHRNLAFATDSRGEVKKWVGCAKSPNLPISIGGPFKRLPMISLQSYFLLNLVPSFRWSTQLQGPAGGTGFLPDRNYVFDITSVNTCAIPRTPSTPQFISYFFFCWICGSLRYQPNDLAVVTGWAGNKLNLKSLAL